MLRFNLLEIFFKPILCHSENFHHFKSMMILSLVTLEAHIFDFYTLFSYNGPEIFTSELSACFTLTRMSVTDMFDY